MIITKRVKVCVEAEVDVVVSDDGLGDSDEPRRALLACIMSDPATFRRWVHSEAVYAFADAISDRIVLGPSEYPLGLADPDRIVVSVALSDACASASYFREAQSEGYEYDAASPVSSCIDGDVICDQWRIDDLDSSHSPTSTGP